ncbi:hypothetical protein [Mycolicibacterium sp. XJ1819]
MSWRKAPPPAPSKPVADMPEHLQIFDLGMWLEPGEDAHDDAPAAYQRHLAARRVWFEQYELPPIEEAFNTPDEPFDAVGDVPTASTARGTPVRP